MSNSKNTHHFFKQILLLGVFFLILTSFKTSSFAGASVSSDSKLKTTFNHYFNPALKVKVINVFFPQKENHFFKQILPFFKSPQSTSIRNCYFNLVCRNTHISSPKFGVYHGYYLYPSGDIEPPSFRTSL